MIYDKLSNARRYMGLHPNLDIALSYIAQHDLASLPLGRTELRGQEVFMNVMDAEARPEDQLSYEFHREYMDIQIDLTGTEQIRIGNMGAMTARDYDSDTDFGTVVCPDAAVCTMGPGSFLICMAGEPHMPGIVASEQTALRKCVFKVHR